MKASGVEAGRRALETVESVLAKRPKKDNRALFDATAQLCIYRDALIEDASSDGPERRERLSHVNAVLSVVAGMHYPLGEMPWSELEKARGWLADLLAKTPMPAG